MTGGLYNPRPIDDTPVNGQVQHGVTSNRMFDHEADVSTHGVSDLSILDDDDLIAALISRGHLVIVPPNVAWGNTLANGASVITSTLFTGVDTNAAQDASGIIYAYFASLNINQSLIEYIDWDKKLRVRFCISIRDLGGDHTNSVYRFQLKEAISEGALAAKGIGIRIDGTVAAPTDLFAESYGVSLAATDLAVNMVNRQPMWMEIIHTPATSIVWKVNGVVKRTETDTDKIPSGASGAAEVICVSAINGTSSGDGRLYVSDVLIWQEA